MATTRSKPKQYGLSATVMTVLEAMVARPQAIIHRYPDPGAHPVVIIPGAGLGPHCTDPIFHVLLDHDLIAHVPGMTYPTIYTITERASAALTLSRLLWEYQLSTPQASILAELAEPGAVLHWDRVGSCQRNIWGEREGQHVLLHKGVAQIACTVLRDKEMIHRTLSGACEHWNLTDVGRQIAEAVLALQTFDKRAVA